MLSSKPLWVTLSVKLRWSSAARASPVTAKTEIHQDPYVHDGSLKTLKDVVDFYVGGGLSNPHRDKEIHSLDFLRARLKSIVTQPA